MLFASIFECRLCDPTWCELSRERLDSTRLRDEIWKADSASATNYSAPPGWKCEAHLGFDARASHDPDLCWLQAQQLNHFWLFLRGGKLKTRLEIIKRRNSRRHKERCRRRCLPGSRQRKRKINNSRWNHVCRARDCLIKVRWDYKWNVWAQILKSILQFDCSARSFWDKQASVD